MTKISISTRSCAKLWRMAVRSRKRSMAQLPSSTNQGRACLANRAARSIGSAGVIEAPAELMVFRGAPDHIRADNGPEITARAVRERPGRVGARTLYIEPGLIGPAFLRGMLDAPFV